MSTSAAYFAKDTSEENIYELQTIHRGSKLGEIQWNTMKMAESRREKKPSITLRERIFGSKKSRKVSGNPNPKYDVVRSLDIVEGGGKPQKDKKKDDCVPTQPMFTHGHKLEVHSKSSWCDTCQELIWGININAMRCKYCRYTCHTKCVSSVYLTCPEAPINPHKTVDENTQELEILNEHDSGNEMENNNLPNYVKSISELKKLIDEYNQHASLLMTLHNDYTFDGFIRVHMNLNRPVNVNTDVSNLTLKKAVARNKGVGRRRRPVTEIFPDNTNVTNMNSNNISSNSNNSTDSGVSLGSTSSTYSDSLSPPLSPTLDTTVLDSMYSRRKAARKLSFYMPKGTYKPLHVTSTTTVHEVIEALLAKYNVMDNPRKYRLFEKHRDKQDNMDAVVTFRQLKDTDKPLVLMLGWGPQNNKYSFSMKEDEGGNIEWMNFEVPELNNFLKILQEEEDKLLAQIYEKYERYRDALETAMESHLS